MGTFELASLLTNEQRTVFQAIRRHASELLDNTPRFKYFTLHGQRHIANVLKNIELLVQAGLKLTQEQAFLLACAVCIHDLGMVVPLRNFTPEQVFCGWPQPSEPANLELQIRALHHELVGAYIKNHFDFLVSLGLSPGDLAILRDISRCHRIVDLNQTQGYVRTLGALLRLVDELDIYPSRAPASILTENFSEMDATSCWHWFKHNICEDWRLGHNVAIESGDLPRITFILAVHPYRSSSIPYWLTQVRRPIARVLYDEGTSHVITRNWGLQISLNTSQDLSSSIALGAPWGEIEQKALSAGRKLILVIDDEVRKMEDLFLPLMDTYHVIFSPNAKDALEKLAAAKVDLAIVDLQIGSGFQWSAEETQDFKLTGVRLCKEIHDKFADTKVGILTGSRHDLTIAKQVEGLLFLHKKPIDPDQFDKEVRRVLA